MQLQKTPNTVVKIKDKDYLFFSGTSYLGIPMLPNFQKIVFQSIQQWGTCYGSSRNANIKLDVYKKGEQFFSNFLKTEDAVTVSSGTIAGQLALKSLHQKVDAFFYMPKTHPAILPKKAMPVFIDSAINSTLQNIKNNTICILADAIATLETTPFSFDFLNSIDSSNKIYILLDESHSLGILGKNGSGISTQISKKSPIEIVIVSSLGKAYGVNGGLIAGSKDFINSIKQHPVFIGCAGMSPAFLAAFLNAQDIYQTQAKKLLKNCTFLYEKIRHLKGIQISKNYPVFFFEDEKIADFLYNHQLLITSFYYASTDKKINRIVINANHSKQQLNLLIEKLILFSKK